MLVVNERMMGKYVHKYMTCGDCGGTTQKGYVEILEFTHFSQVFRFNHTGGIGRKKEISHEIKVSVVMELV